MCPVGSRCPLEPSGEQLRIHDLHLRNINTHTGSKKPSTALSKSSEDPRGLWPLTAAGGGRLWDLASAESGDGFCLLACLSHPLWLILSGSFSDTEVATEMDPLT